MSIFAREGLLEVALLGFANQLMGASSILLGARMLHVLLGLFLDGPDQHLWEAEIAAFEARQIVASLVYTVIG